MSAPLLQLDFAGPRLRGGPIAVAVAILGGLCLTVVLVQQHYLSEQLAGLELRRSALADESQHGRSLRSVAGLSTQTAEKTVRELGTPWSQLLWELEKASGDNAGNIALLSVAPDYAKHRVRVIAEARTLELALAYVQRLHNAPVLRFPMLESHELRTDDKDHPVRFQVSADWSDAS
jgi:hypothetical protein